MLVSGGIQIVGVYPTNVLEGMATSPTPPTHRLGTCVRTGCSARCSAISTGLRLRSGLPQPLLVACTDSASATDLSASAAFIAAAARRRHGLILCGRAFDGLCRCLAGSADHGIAREPSFQRVHHQS